MSSVTGSKQTRERSWRMVNITPLERAARIVVGLAAVVAAAVLLTSASSAIAVVLELALAAAGVDLVLTGALGHCPLYARLGHVPAPFRRAP